MACKWDGGWAGRCRAATIDGSEYCEKHHTIQCVSCGQKATNECPQCGVQFVCGAPLCDNCVHGTPEPGKGGMFGLGGGHRRRKEAK